MVTFCAFSYDMQHPIKYDLSALFLSSVFRLLAFCCLLWLVEELTGVLGEILFSAVEKIRTPSPCI